MEFIISDQDGMEVGILKERQYIDIDCGGNNDFEIQISRKLYKSLGIVEGWRIGVPGKEYGGIIDKIKNNSSTNKVTLSGPTWRGLLTKKIIEPDPGEDYKVVSGEANTIINNVSCVVFDGIFVCTGASGIMLNNYHFDRYVDHLAGLEKMLRSQNARLEIAYDSGEPNEASFVKLSAVPIEDYSDEIEYSRDGTLSFLTFEFERYTGGINHLICLGKGELKDRLVIHLYVQEDGSIGSEKYYTGKDERVSVFDYSNAESAADLQEKGIERLKELMSYTNMDMDLRNQSLSGIRGVTDDIDIGDIVGGRDFDTGIYLSKQITRKIIQVKNGRESIEYSVGKNTLNRSTATAPAEPEDAYQKQIDELSAGKLTSIKINTNDASSYQTVVDQWDTLPNGPWSIDIEAKSQPLRGTAFGYKTGAYGHYSYMDYTGHYDINVYNGTIDAQKVDDFVVAQGTSGIWTYRKWNSGIAECWGDYLFTPTSFSNVSNTLFYCYMGNVSTPFKFVSMNTCHINKRNGGYVTWATPNVSLDTTAAVNALIFQYGNSNFASMRLDIHCKGKWK